MADEDASAEGGGPEGADSLDVDMEFVDALPGGRLVMGLEKQEKRFTWLVVRGEISPQAGAELIADLNHIVRSGLWEQNWQPPRAG